MKFKNFLFAAGTIFLTSCTAMHNQQQVEEIIDIIQQVNNQCIIRKSKFPQNPKRSVRFSGKRTKRSVQKRKARNTQKAETKVL